METEVDLQELLAWYVDAGVTVALGDQPIDRFQQAVEEASNKSAAPARNIEQPTGQKPPPKSSQPESAPPPEQRKAAVAPTESIVSDAVALAAKCETLEDLKAAITGFEGCNLKATARNSVFADGNPDAPLMIVGEAPGRDEDEQGLPFVGQSGQLLDRMLAAIGLDRTSVYIANVLPWRPPGNRAPTPSEVAICKPFIDRHMELIEPKCLMLIGGSSAKAILNSPQGIMSLRGKWTDIDVGGKAVPVMPTLHPAYLLRQPAHKRLAWNDLLEVKARMEKPAQSGD